MNYSHSGKKINDIPMQCVCVSVSVSVCVTVSVSVSVCDYALDPSLPEVVG